MAERTHWWAIALIILTTVLTSSAQVFYKTAAAQLPVLFTNWQLFAGMACYIAGALLLTLSLKGGEVSVLYPFLATSYLWVTLAAYLVYGETIGALKIIGVFIIMIGVSVIGYASKKSSAVVIEVP